MAGFRLRLRDFIDKTFRDEIVDIEPPKEWWFEYRDVGKRLEGYIIPVTYKYRGRCYMYSSIDNDHFGLVTPQRALKEAERFYNKTQQKLLQKRSRAINENTK